MEKKYTVGFIGDNTHATLPKQKLANFLKELNNFSKTKKKLLLESIKLAKEMLESKGKGAEEKDKISNNIKIEKSIKRVKFRPIKKKESDSKPCEKLKPRRKPKLIEYEKLLNSKRKRCDSNFSIT
jgi:hypothetical protein